MGDRAIRSGWLIRLAALLALLAPLPVLAWGSYGHETSAQIALANMSPQSRAQVTRLLRASPQLGTPGCALATLEDASTWPDCLRRDGWRWGYTFAWHYQTQPVCEAYDARKNCPGGNCVRAQIERSQRVLADESLPDAVRLEALAFLVHFVGDIHMPLHSGDDGDRGGNDRVVDYGIVPALNLHWIWDGPLAERAISSAQPALVRRYSASERAELGGGSIADWGRESWEIARDIVYPGAFGRQPCAGNLPDETALTQDAIVAALPIAERRVTQAGLRIAVMVDAAFAPGPLPRPTRD
ncbi:S1/P1 nuclease [Qipengyuania marisflavi]|uniref:S1/P1 nuclease n=1 Tax=Qipengyuania marisflavi TaxID=2486356 RepID=A0A5S3P2Y2_9SPHN|nr:S1/P1 nuclease [Qipengyuania marisflavi]TMM47148.1 S1/P1 nuclease [Qipengyuania marisflavi]